MDRRDDQDLPLTHAQLAAMVGIGRNYASRLPQVFREAGLIQSRRGGLRITDQEGLARPCLPVSGNAAPRRVLLGVYPTRRPTTSKSCARLALA